MWEATGRSAGYDMSRSGDFKVGSRQSNHLFGDFGSSIHFITIIPHSIPLAQLSHFTVFVKRGTPGESESPMGKKNKWKGVTIDLLKRLRLKFCRAQTRPTLRSENLDEDCDPGGMAGRLINNIYTWLTPKQHIGPFPTLTDLGKACEKPVKLNVLNKFLNGNATRGTHWFMNARDMLRTML